MFTQFQRKLRKLGGDYPYKGIATVGSPIDPLDNHIILAVHVTWLPCSLSSAWPAEQPLKEFRHIKKLHLLSNVFTCFKCCILWIFS